MIKRDVNSRFAFALKKIEEALGKDKAAVIGIDGRCGSGKTSFAKLIAQAVPCNVVHMDDFYLPLSKREENWMDTPGGNMDFERLCTEVFLPLQAGELALYRPYHCRTGEYGEIRRLSPTLPLVVEGSYSLHPKGRLTYGLTLFLTCDKAEQMRRLKEREGDSFSAFLERWIPMEESYFRLFRVEERSDIRIDTGEKE